MKCYLSVLARRVAVFSPSDPIREICFQKTERIRGKVWYMTKDTPDFFVGKKVRV